MPKKKNPLDEENSQQFEDEEYNSSLQDSLQDFDDVSGQEGQSDDEEGSNQGGDSDGMEADEDSDDNNDDLIKEGSTNRRKKSEEEEEKRDYYKQYLQPDEEVETDAPLTVVVQGSSKSGKSSLIRSLVKFYTKYKIDKINGPITLRSNKKQRLTIIECPNDSCAMMDLSKVADIAVLLIDASLGFEMETFEFLSLLKSHGFPNVMGVLTHLDFFKENKQQRKTKKKFKKRFEYEVGGNYKLFNLDKWQNGLYEKIQIAKIARHLATSKGIGPYDIPWRQNHPYIIADRWQTFEDQGYKEEDKVDVSFYGYVRGSSYRMNGKIHIVGVGDFMIKQMEVVNDPCPEYIKKDADGKSKPKLKGDIEDMGKIMADMDVENGAQNDGENSEEQSNENNITSGHLGTTTPVKRKRRTLNQQQRIIYAPGCNLGTMHLDHTSGYITIPKEYVKFTKMVNEDDEENEQSNAREKVEEGIQLMRNMQSLSKSMNQRLREREDDFELFDGVKVAGGADGAADSRNPEGETVGREQQGTSEKFKGKQRQISSLKKETENIELINPHEDHDQQHRHDDLHTLIYESKQPMKTYDCSKYHPQGIHDPQKLKALCVTGMEDDVLKEQEDSSEDESYGGREDTRRKKEREIKKVLNTNYTKASISEQTNMFQKGRYVCVTLEGVKYGTFERFSHEKPMVLARINLGEDNYGFINVKFKRHRWYTNLLKSNDPIIVSSGWRRYQTMVVFATQDQNDRMRFLKYTPKHDFCNAIIYGNFVQQNSGVIFQQTIRNDIKKFRVAGTGIVTEINKSFEIMKKIKLIGEPYKIMKNTVFVKGMFNSSMEVSNYIGAQIRTVSGIRGQVKKAIKEGGEGTFRATFQDKVSISDIIFCRAWYKVILERYYNPIETYNTKKRIMKTKYELRMQKGIQAEKKPDSEYKEIDRAPKVFNPFILPKKLEAKLPFKSADKIRESKKEQIRRAESQKIPKILQSDKERQVASLIQRLNTIKNVKAQKQEEKFKEKRRLQEAREKPKQAYYQQVKRQQKAEKMANLTRKKNQELRKRNKRAEQED